MAARQKAVDVDPWIGGRNFRLLHRLFVQIEPILKINEMSSVTDDVIEAASPPL